MSSGQSVAYLKCAKERARGRLGNESSSWVKGQGHSRRSGDEVSHKLKLNC